MPASPPTETEKNGRLVKGIREISKLLGEQNPGVAIECYGSAAVAAGNAFQLKRDIMVTLGIALSLIILLLGWYFRNLRIPLLGFLPALFGGAFSLAVIFLVKGRISGIALGIGSVILGLIIDYALYLINHFRLKQSVEEVLRDMSQSIVVCCLTTAGAFLCLVFLDSSVLHDLGLFAALSVTGAAIFSLIILPQFLSSKFIKPVLPGRTNFIDKLASIRLERKWIFLLLLMITVAIGLFFMNKITFEKDLTSLNYLSPELKRAEQNLDALGGGKVKKVYVVACDRGEDNALRKNEAVAMILDKLTAGKRILGFGGIRSIILPDSLRQSKIARWDSFWNSDRRKEVRITLDEVSVRAGFRKGAFTPFYELLEKNYTADSGFRNEDRSLAADWISHREGYTMVTTLVNVKPGETGAVYEALKNRPGIVVFDRQNLTNRFVAGVKHDFSLLVNLSMIFVTLLLLLSFGRIEIGITAAIPMFFSWFITLGFMGVTGIKFNIFNIIISSFIFGLGVDYSILMMRGMLYEYKYGTSERNSYKSAILLSSLTTLFGVGALFFAGHPALRSIAMISVVGIVSVVLATFSVEPLLTGWFLLDRLPKHKFPVTARILIKTLITWGNITLISVLMMITGSLIYLLLPMSMRKKKLIFHRIFSILCRLYIFVTFPTNGRLINPFGEDFKKPCVIISNHQSLIETPAFLRLYPRILILTTEWVFRSPVFGPIARLAGFINIEEGLETSIEKLRRQFSEGYSVLVFPEGHRSVGGRIQRFHRGAFYMAEQLKVDILPILVFGSGDFLARGDFFGKPNGFRMKILQRITPEDVSFGKTYTEKTKALRRHYISLYEQAKEQEGTAAYYRRLLLLNYVFKGPVLEWYVRIKMNLEKNFELYTRLMPRSGRIVDIGCGYGYVSYLLAMTAGNRQITGVDYDPEKIRVADNCFSKSANLRFICSDITQMNFEKTDGYLLLDILHYLPVKEQVNLLRKCMANLDERGVIIIRDADASMEKRHTGSKITEFFSTGIGFNKTRDGFGSLCFSSSETINRIANEFGFRVGIIDNKKHTSNIIYIITGEQGTKNRDLDQTSQEAGIGQI